MKSIEQIPSHWLLPPSLDEAAQIQRELAEQVILATDPDFAVQRVMGVDASNNLYDPEKMIYAGTVQLNYPALTVMAESHAAMKSRFPYVPGFLGFREAPIIIEALQGFAEPPDLILVDGHGVSHPRGLGIASQLGVLLDCPTIGVAKSILVGTPDGVLGPNPGDQVPLVWRGNRIGTVLRTKLRTNPLYIAPGHRMSHESAVQWVLNCLKGYRLPEPTRQAHLSANACRRARMNQLVPAQPLSLFSTEDTD